MSRDDFQTKKQNAAIVLAANEFASVLKRVQERNEKEEADKNNYNLYYARKKAEEAAAQLAAQNSASVNPAYQAVQIVQNNKEERNSSQITAAELQYFQQLSREIFTQVFGAPLPSFSRNPQRGRNKSPKTTTNDNNQPATTTSAQPVATQAQPNPIAPTVNNGNETKDTNISEGAPAHVDGSYSYEVDSNNDFADDFSHESKNSEMNFRPEPEFYDTQKEDHINQVKEQLRFDEWVETNEILNGHSGNKITFTILNQRVNLYLCELAKDDRLMSKFGVSRFAMAIQQDHQLAFHLDLRGFANDLESAYYQEVAFMASSVPLSKNQCTLIVEDAKYRQQYGSHGVQVTSPGFGMSFAQEE